MPTIEFECRPVIIGSMPHTEQGEACNLVNRYLKDFPAWPQLPRRSFLENMYVQFSEGFPGVVIEGLPEKGLSGTERISLDHRRDLNKSLESLYSAYLQNDPQPFAISRKYAAGLYQFLDMTFPDSLAVKGQITGPVSWSLTVTDADHKPLIYDDILVDAVSRMIRLKALWQEQQLLRLNKNTIIFVDEPYLSSYGSAFLPVSKEKILSLLGEVIGGISGLRGIHCCGNTDWSIVLEASIDIVSFDAFNYAESFNLYLPDIIKFFNHHGTIAWGIVPVIPEILAKESVPSLMDRLGEAMAPLTRAGIPFRQIVKQGILTPSCGLAILRDDETVESALQLLVDLSTYIRRKYL